MRDSCFSNESLVRIATIYNKQYPDSPSRISPDIIAKASGPRTSKAARQNIVKAVRKAFLDKCSRKLLPHHHDACILQTEVGPEVSRDIGRDESRAPPPIAPTNGLLKGKPWNTYEVNTAMEHIERKYPRFMFLETTPIDFAEKDEMGRCTVSELCRFDIRNVVRYGKTSFGVVFNTHTHDQPGGHWICVYCCLVTGRICYYDSYGHKPEYEVIEFMNSVAEQYKTYYGKTMDKLYNDYPNQTGGVECGTFCILFLDFMEKYGDIKKATHVINDEANAKKLRKYLLSPSLYA